MWYARAAIRTLRRNSSLDDDTRASCALAPESRTSRRPAKTAFIDTVKSSCTVSGKSG